MTTYIDTETLQYPLHAGDAPNGVVPATWVSVPYTEPPAANSDQLVYEGAPSMIDGEWTRQWFVRERTEEERLPTMFMAPHEQQDFEAQRLAALAQAATKETLDAIQGSPPDVIE